MDGNCSVHLEDLSLFLNFCVLSQLSINYDFGDTIDYEDSIPCKSLATGDVGPTKAWHSVPHDLGNPAGES